MAQKIMVSNNNVLENDKFLGCIKLDGFGQDEPEEYPSALLIMTEEFEKAGLKEKGIDDGDYVSFAPFREPRAGDLVLVNESPGVMKMEIFNGQENIAGIARTVTKYLH